MLPQVLPQASPTWRTVAIGALKAYALILMEKENKLLAPDAKLTNDINMIGVAIEELGKQAIVETSPHLP